MTKRKSLFTIVFSFVLILCCSFIFTACGIPSNEDNGGNDDQQTSEYTDNLNTAAQIKSAIGDVYYVTVDAIVSSSESDDEEVITYTIVSNGTWFWGDIDGSVYFIQKQDNTYTSYYYDEETDTYTESYSFTPDDESEMVSFDLSVLLAGSLFNYTTSINYTSKQNKTLLGRNAVEYTQHESYNVPGYASFSWDETIVIDSATGACLKHSVSGSAAGGGQSASAAYSFECTKFVVGASNDITTKINIEIAKIAQNQD